jgi:lipoprotein-anchoring transpeptidase ErfK/SrfK
VKPSRKKVIIGISTLVCSLLIIYFGVAAYYANHFYHGSVINGINASGKTVDEVKSEIAAQLKDYSLSFKERGGKTEQIKASDIEMKYDADKLVKELKDKQKGYKWISAYINKKNANISLELVYNKDLLKKQFDNLACFDSKNVVEPKDAGIKYTDNGYVIENEVMGTKINKDDLYSKAENAVKKLETSIDLESQKLYINPKYTSKSEKLVESKTLLNKYIASKTTYKIGGQSVVLDGATIKQWIYTDKDFTAKIDEEKVRQYVQGLANKYNTVGRARNFHTSSGAAISVGGGDYGYSISVDDELQSLLTAIKEGQVTERTPKYAKTAFGDISNDIGNTYVEVDMTKQHIWFYKNGALVVQSDIVTGDLATNCGTPTGIYSVKLKQRNATLKGEDYATPVAVWMPFVRGVGMHDAYWRDKFGGEIYKTNGSHGCVNCPPDVAGVIFNNIDVGTPVVCFY